MEHKRYSDIQVAREDNIGAFEVGDHIYIQTKIDGANAAIRYDADNDCLVAQSRRQILGMGNTLNGFFDYVQSLDKNRFKVVLCDNYIIYGEWLIRHTVAYRDDAMRQFYAFDVYDTNKNTYLPQKEVKKIAKLLCLNYVENLYEGEFVSWEHCRLFLNHSCYGEQQQEGIVVKNMTKLADDNNRQPVYLKIVNEQFKETKSAPKQKKPPVDNSEVIAAVKTIVTPRRVQKMIQQAQDEGILKYDLNITDMGAVCKCIPMMVYEDCVKEELETVNSIENFSKFCSKVSIDCAKEILSSKNV